MANDIAWVTVGTPSISLIQVKSYGSTTQSTTHIITFDSTPTSGNLLILGVVGDSTISSVSGTGWVQRCSAVDNTGTYIYSKVAGGSEPTAITVTLTGSTSCCLGLMEWNGVSTFDQQDGNINQGPSTVVCGPTPSTVVAVELSVALSGLSDASAGTPTPTVSSWSNSYTSQLSSASSGIGIRMNLNMATLITSSTGAQTTTATLSGTMVQAHSSGAIATFS